MKNIKKADTGSRLATATGEDSAQTAEEFSSESTIDRRPTKDTRGPARVRDSRRIAGYARVSSQKQADEDTIQSQIAAIQTFAQEHDMVLCDENLFVDEGYSGSSLTRPALDELRDRVAEDNYQAIYVYDPDRLARSYVHQVLLIEEFQERGCALEFVRRPIGQSPDEQLLLQMQGVIAEYERTKIKERTRRGKMHRMRQGELVTGRRTFGYHYFPRTVQLPARFEVIPEEAETLRKMFDWYTSEELSLRAIASRLTEAGIQTVRQNRWRASSVRQVLMNSMYTGTGYANRVKAVLPKTDRPLDPVYRKYPKTGKEIRDREEWMAFNCPAVISQEIYEIAQKRLESNKAMSARNTQNEYLLRGLIECGQCGKHMQVYTQNKRYHCPYTRKTQAADAGCRECTNNERFPAADLDKLVWQETANLLNRPSILKEQHKSLKGNLSPKATGGRSVLTQKHKKLKEQLSRVNALFIKGMLAETDHQAQYRVINDKIHALEQQLKAHENEHYEEQEVIQLLETFSKFQKTIKQQLETAHFETRREIVLQTIKRIILSKNNVTIEYAAPLKKCSLRTVSGE